MIKPPALWTGLLTYTSQGLAWDMPEGNPIQVEGDYSDYLKEKEIRKQFGLVHITCLINDVFTSFILNGQNHCNERVTLIEFINYMYFKYEVPEEFDKVFVESFQAANAMIKEQGQFYLPDGLKVVIQDIQYLKHIEAMKVYELPNILQVIDV